jgi:hypothetical protein
MPDAARRPSIATNAHNASDDTITSRAKERADGRGKQLRDHQPHVQTVLAEKRQQLPVRHDRAEDAQASVDGSSVSSHLLVR